MNHFMNSLGKDWLEWRGRKRPATRYPFADTEIISAAEELQISPWWNAIYLNLHPTHFAVAIAPDGGVVSLRGGYNHPLLPGRYTLHYVDKLNRKLPVPRISETTRDGSQVTLDISITYAVTDPIRALQVEKPVETLLSFLTSDLKEFIRARNYDEIIGDNNSHTIDNELVARYIKSRHATRHQMSRLFLIDEVVVNAKAGDPKLTEIRGNFQVQQRQNIASGELAKLNQELEKKIASQEAEIKQIKAKSEADQQEITQRLRMQGLEFERARAELQAQLQYRQETMTQAMNAIGHALSASTYPLDAHAMEIIRNIIGEFRGQTNPEPVSEVNRENPRPPQRAGTPNMEKIGTLTETLLNWLDNKR